MSILITQNPEKFVKYENKPEVNRLLFKNINYGNSDDVKEIAYGAYPSVSVSEPSAFASFNDGADDIPVKNITVQIKPVQDLHGQSNPYPAGGGKNILDPNVKFTAGTYHGLTLSTTDGYRYTLTGTATDSGNIVTSSVASQDAVILPAGTYYSKVGTLSLYKADGTWLKNQYSGVAFTVDETFFVKNVYIEIVSGRTYNYNDFIAVEKGSTAPTEWTPYSNICPISGWTGANVSRTGFNQWDEQWELGTIDSSGNNQTNSTTIRSKNYIPVIPNTTYYYKSTETAGLRFYDANKVFVSSLTRTANATFVVPENAHYLRFVVLNGYGTTYNHDICINLSDPAKNGTYEPYHGNTYSITFPTEAGTVYGGTLDVTSGVLTVDRAYLTNEQLVASGWESAGRGVFVASSAYALPNVADTSYVNPKLIASALPTKSQNVIYTETSAQMGIAQWWGNRFAIALADSSISSASAFREKLAENGTDVVYPLATPQTYQLTPTEVSTLLGLNNIWADCGDTTVDYRADTKLYIEQLTAPSEDDMTANTTIPDATYFMVGNTLYLSTTTIPAGDTINPGTNCTKMSLAEALNAINS